MKIGLTRLKTRDTLIGIALIGFALYAAPASLGAVVGGGGYQLGSSTRHGVGEVAALPDGDLGEDDYPETVLVQWGGVALSWGTTNDGTTGDATSNGQLFLAPYAEVQISEMPLASVTLVSEIYWGGGAIAGTNGLGEGSASAEFHFGDTGSSVLEYTVMPHENNSDFIRASVPASFFVWHPSYPYSGWDDISGVHYNVQAIRTRFWWYGPDAEISVDDGGLGLYEEYVTYTNITTGGPGGTPRHLPSDWGPWYQKCSLVTSCNGGWASSGGGVEITAHVE